MLETLSAGDVFDSAGGFFCGLTPIVVALTLFAAFFGERDFERRAAITMEPVTRKAGDVDVDDITIAQGSIVWDTVTYTLVDRRAAGTRKLAII